MMTGQDLLAAWTAFIRTYVYCSKAQGMVLALWAINTWVYEHFAAVPYLEIVARTKESGKTTVLDVLKMLCRGPEKFAIVRVLTILRMIEEAEGKITILIDEAEQFSKPSLGETRSGIATGYKPGAQHAISVGKGFQRFRTYAPWAFAQIGNVHDVLRSRCIEIMLERGKPERYLIDYEMTAKADAGELLAHLVLYAKGKTKDGKMHIPIIPADWLTSGREREIWTPLISVASWLGVHADVMRELQAASVDLGLLKTLPPIKWHSAQDESDTEERDMAVRLLRDLATVVGQPGDDGVIFSREAVERLRGIETAPWRGWRGTGINEIGLASLLRRYGLESKTQRRGKGRKGRTEAQGYSVAHILAARKADE
jgi:hypothetical protein